MSCTAKLLRLLYMTLPLACAACGGSVVLDDEDARDVAGLFADAPADARSEDAPADDAPAQDVAAAKDGTPDSGMPDSSGPLDGHDDAEPGQDALDTTDEPDTGPACPYGAGQCIGLEYFTCQPGTLKVVTEDCASKDPCLLAGCQDGIGCQQEELDAVPCNDGNACTQGERCVSGSCVPLSQLSCDDSNPCTTNGCLPAVGCSFTPDDSLPCDDGLACTEGDYCEAGACVPGANACTCDGDADCLPFDDGNPCSGFQVCQEGFCSLDPATVPDCSALIAGPCHVPACDPVDGVCKLKAKGDFVACEDGDPCTAGDHCAGGSCLSGEQADCDDGNPCTADSCSAGASCVHAPLAGVGCTDGNPCTIGDACAGGVCLPGALLLVCDDGNACTSEACVPGSGCLYEDVDAPCDDGNACTVGDSCAGGMCSGAPLTCAEGKTCVFGVCQCASGCAGKECGTDACGTACGSCGPGKTCNAGQCEPLYPPGPYGTYAGATIANHQLIDPADGSTVELQGYLGVGKLLLITWNAGWCVVCQKDTSLLNNWLAVYGPAGLSILSIMYETYSQEPMTAAYALWWKGYFGVSFDLVIDSPYADAQGKAAGGVLGQYLVPSGPIPDGTFPVTVVVCTKTMRILYIHEGFYDEEQVHPLVVKYLYEKDCAKE